MDRQEQYQRDRERAKRYVIENEDTIRKIYDRRFIAVVPKGRVVDCDKDEMILARRIEIGFGDKFVLIGTIDDILNPLCIHLESPETGSEVAIHLESPETGSEVAN